MIDPIHFKDLAAENPDRVIKRCDAAYDGKDGGYRVRFWNREIRVIPEQQEVSCPGLNFAGSWAYVPLILVHYLLSAKKTAPGGDWVSEKDLPGGAAFFRGPHTLPVNLVAEGFKAKTEEFHTRCRDLGGQVLGMADAAYAFPLLPSIPAAVLFWEADEMFGADTRLLFDRTISDHLPLDIIYALGVTLCRVLSDEPPGIPPTG